MLREEGVDLAELSIRENAFGKPEIVSPVGLFVGLSHAEERVMAVVAHSPVGCDVERIRDFKPEIGAEALSPDELAEVTVMADERLRAKFFCRCWVRKESYAKAIGRGLADGPKTISTLELLRDRAVEFADFDFEDGYLGCVCRLLR